MSPHIALDVLESAPRKAMTVVDPMCGSGTVLSHGARLGHSVIGFDVDPLALLMARVATTEIHSDHVLKVGEEVVASAAASRSSKPPWHDVETEKFARYWFAADQYRDLARLSHRVAAVEDSAVKDLLYVALSRIIITKTPKASLAADSAHSRPHRVMLTSSFDVMRGFAESVARTVSVQAGFKKLGKSTVEYGDARELRRGLTGKADLVITSPPYLNAIDYLRGHRLSLIWMGYEIPALRRLRTESIGSEAALKQDTKLYESILREGVPNYDSLSLPIGMLKRYIRDMFLVARSIERSLKPNGKLILVVADSNIKGTPVPTSTFITRTLELNGLKIDDISNRQIPPSKRYLPVAGGGAALEG